MGRSYGPHPSLQMQELKPHRGAQMPAQGDSSVPTPTPGLQLPVAYPQVSGRASGGGGAGMDTGEEWSLSPQEGSIAGVPRGGGRDGMWIFTNQP